MTLDKHIEEIRAKIKSVQFPNEASVSQGIVLRLLHALSWPPYDTQIICPEYSLGGRRVDFALCHPPGKPIAFIEVKQHGQSEGAERQLFEYAFHEGVPLAILTDGQEWNFYLPGAQGDYGERRVYKLDIVERVTEECVSRLTRYLGYAAIVSGAAIAAAQEDYRNVAKDRQIIATLPKAWAKLVEEEDDILLELIADQVESLCGYKPAPDIVTSFLKSNISLTQVATRAPVREIPRKQKLTPLSSAIAPGLPCDAANNEELAVEGGRRQEGITVTIDGRRFVAETVGDLYDQVLRFLCEQGYIQKLKSYLPFKTSNKRYLIALEPMHPRGNKFMVPIEYGGYFMEAHKDYKNALSHLTKLLALCGLELRK